MRGMVALLLAGACMAATPAFATPARIIILRHGEKADGWKLCPTGQARGQALAANYLGKDSAQSLFPDRTAPAAIAAITLHTLELAAPAATSWPIPMTVYGVIPQPNQSKEEFTVVLNKATQEAANEILFAPAYVDETVVMVWEHDHIADAKLEAAYPGERVTLRQLLDLDTLAGVPETWPGDNYDYFWIVEFDTDTNKPKSFRMVKQDFGSAFPTVPSNDWGKPNGLTSASGCEG